MAAAKKVAVKKSTLKKEKASAQIKEAPVKAAPASEQASYVVIDHPINGEVVLAGHYAVRIGASWGGIVEFQINNEDWIPCRHNAGYWWFDWHNIPLGKHKLVARIVDGNGNVVKKSETRRIEVK